MEPKQKPNLTTEQVNNLIGDLLDKSSIVDGDRRLAPGAVNDSAIKFKIGRNQVYKLWRSALKKKKRDWNILSQSKEKRKGWKAYLL